MNHSTTLPHPAHDTIAVVIAERLQLTAWCLEQFISTASAHIKVLGVVHSFEHLIEHPALPNANVILLNPNIRDPLVDMVQILSALRYRSAARILALAKKNCTPAEQLHLITLGVKGIVSQNTDEDMLVRAIQKIHEGQIWLDRKMIGSAIHHLAQPEPSKPNPERASGTPAQNVKPILTPRERQVIKLMTQRFDLKQFAIATELGMSENTLRNHLTSIYSKLGVRSRLELHTYASNYKSHR